MVELLNGEDKGPLAGWVIVIAHGKTFLGKWSESEPRLSPAYELVTVMQMVQPDPRQAPQLMTIRQATPVLTFPSLRSVPCAIGTTIVFQIAELSSKERRELAASVEACEQLMGAMRAQESGLVLPPPGAKLPPMKRQ